MGCGTSFVKYVLFFFNLLVALLGIAVVTVGVVFQLNYAPIKQELESHVTVAPWIFIITGAIMFVIAFFGCCGAIRESHCMVVTYAIFLLVIIIVQVLIAVLIFVYGDSFRHEVDKAVGQVFDKNTSPSVNRDTDTVVNQIQTQFACCGKNGPQDYGLALLPPSCCTTSKISSLTGGTCIIANADYGCVQKIGEFYQKWNKPIAGISIGVACVEVVGALFALCLANSIRNMDRRSHY